MPDNNFYYSSKYLNRKFSSSLFRDLSKKKICDEIENKSGDETNFVTVTGIDESSNQITVKYSYYEFGEREEEEITLSLENLYI